MVTKRQRREAVELKRQAMLAEEKRIGLLAQEADKARRAYDREHPTPDTWKATSEAKKKSKQSSKPRGRSTASE